VKKVKVKIKAENCLGCAGCIILAPKLFEYDEKAKARIKKAYRADENERIGVISDEDLIKLVKQIASLCPTYSIEIEEQN